MQCKCVYVLLLPLLLQQLHMVAVAWCTHMAGTLRVQYNTLLLPWPTRGLLLRMPWMAL